MKPGSAHDPYELSYQASSLDKTGRIISKEKKRAIREKEGYCLTCPGTPSKLFEIKKSRLNPLWVQKKPQTIEGQSLNGWCVKCNPALNRDPSKRELYSARKQSVADPLPRGSDHSGRSGRSDVSTRSAISDSPRSVTSTTSAASFVTPTSNFITVQAKPEIIRSVARTASESRLGPGSRAPQPRQHSFTSASRMVPKREHSGSGSVRSLGSPHSGIPRNVVNAAAHGRQFSIVSQSSDSEVSSRSMDAMMERQSSLRNFGGRSSRLNSLDRESSLRSMGSLGSGHSQQRDSFKDRHSLSGHNGLNARQLSQRSFVVEGHSSFRSIDSTDSFSGQRNPGKVDLTPFEKNPSFLNTSSRTRSLTQRDSMEGLDHGSGNTCDERRVHGKKSFEDSFTSELTELPSTSEESHIQSRDPIVSQPAVRRRAPRTASFRKRQEGSVPRHLTSRTNSSRSFGSFESDEEYNRQSPSAPADSASVLLGDVENLLSDIKDVQDPELIIDVLIDSMDSHIKVQEIQCFCIGRIAELFADISVDCTHLFTSNGHKSILMAMKTFPSSLCVQEKGLEALANLALRENTRKLLLREGVCTLIDSALHRFLAEEKMVVFAVQALRALSCDRECAVAMEELRMSEKVVEVMHCNMMSVSIQRDGCSLLSNLVVDVDNQQVSQVNHSALLVIEAAMREHQHDPTVQASACFALKNLSYEQNNLRMISKSESVIELLMKAQEFANASADAMFLIERIQVCSAEDQSLEEQVCESLHLLVEARSGQPEVVDDIMETMENYQWSERILSICIDHLFALVTESEHCKRGLSEKKQIDRLELFANSSGFSGTLLQQTHQLIRLIRESA